MTKTQYAKDVDTFKESEDWAEWVKTETLRAPPSMREYLENRLLRAFEAGWKARDAVNGPEQL